MLEAIEEIKRKVSAANFVSDNPHYFQRRVVEQAKEVLYADAANDYVALRAAGLNHMEVEEDWGL